MAVLCLILDEDNKNKVQGDVEKGYLNNSSLMPIRRVGGTNGNPEPCYILNAAVLDNPDFAAAHRSLRGLPTKQSDAPDFPPAFPDE